jgi:hypothetical protein
MGLHACRVCPLQRYAAKRPQSLLARLWHWHTGWCPGWKAYQRSLEEQERTDREGKDAPRP